MLTVHQQEVPEQVCGQGCTTPCQAVGALLCSSSRWGAKERWGPVSSFQLPLDLVLEQVRVGKVWQWEPSLPAQGIYDLSSASVSEV